MSNEQKVRQKVTSNEQKVQPRMCQFGTVSGVLSKVSED